MSNITSSVYKMHYMDELAASDSTIHKLHPISKLVVTLTFVVTVVSHGKYNISGLLPYIFYPAVILSMAEIPFLPIARRILWISPLVIGVGAFNPVFDRTAVSIFTGLTVSGGWISFAALLIKGGLAVCAALLLVATTGIEKIALALRMLKISRLFVLQLLLTYRYIFILMEEAGRVWSAYALRAPGQRGVHFRAWGSLTGQLLMRTVDRGQRIYQAMSLRGFNGEYNTGAVKRFSITDMAYMCGWSGFFVISLAYDLPVLIGAFFTGVMK